MRHWNGMAEARRRIYSGEKSASVGRSMGVSSRTVLKWVDIANELAP